MTLGVFGSGYSAAYDILYQDKDYEAECDLVERVFRDYALGPVHRVLDLGCGTGNHAIPLARRGYSVVGVDRSEGMLARAREKVEHWIGPDRPAFRQGDVTNVALGETFGAVLLMFAVLGYQVEDPEVLAALAVARRHLRPHGLLFFDVWYGPAVLRERPSQRLKVLPTPDGELLRVASGELDVQRQVCTVGYEMWRLAGDRLVERTTESHDMRFFFPRELDLLLGAAGFEPVRVGAFPEIDDPPDETTWNVAVVARAR